MLIVILAIVHGDIPSVCQSSRRVTNHRLRIGNLVLKCLVVVVIHGSVEGDPVMRGKAFNMQSK